MNRTTNLRRIRHGDAWLVDSDHNVVGVQLTNAGNTEFAALPETLTNKRLGGDDTNYVTVENGALEFVGSMTVWDDLRVEPTVRSSGTTVPTFTKWFDNGAGSLGVFLYNFSDEVTANQKELHFQVQFPHAWAGTKIYPHIHWVASAAGTGQRPVFGLEYTWADIGQTFGTTTIAYTDALIPSEANLVQSKHYISTWSSGLEPSTNQDGISSILLGRVFRYSGNASDTYTGVCGVLYIDIHYELNTLGSREEFTK